MFKKYKKEIIKVVLSIIFLILATIFNNIIFSFIAYFIAGFEILKKAFNRLIRLKPIDENFLMSVATIGAILLGEYNEACFVMIFYEIGELFENIAVDKTRGNIRDLMSFKPTKAYIENVNGESESVDPENVKIGDILHIKPGDKIPVDAEIISGITELDTSMLTGESIPRIVREGDIVESGLVNISNFIKAKAIKVYNDSTANKIIDLIENASSKKSKSENFITEFAKIYTPVVCAIALIIFLVPLILHFLFNPNIIIADWGYRALTLLVISCPCAIVLSVPLAFFASIGNASKNGILIKGSEYIETLSKVKSIAFDKTGTMTKGVFEVVGIHHCKLTEDEILMYASHAEFYSNHPIAKSIVRAYSGKINEKIIKDTKEISGYGIVSEIDGKTVLLGNERLMKDNNIDFLECHDNGTIVHVAINNVYEGHIVIKDIIKDNAKNAINMLKKLNVNNIILLTGDNKSTALDAAKELNIDNVKYELKPDDKLRIVEEILLNNNDKLAFVGDGINDAPSIKRADIGISMGGSGTDSAIEVSDIVLLKDDPIDVVKAIKIAKSTMNTIYLNIIFTLFIKVLFILLSTLGITNMWFAVFADVGVMIICVIHSMLLLIKKSTY